MLTYIRSSVFARCLRRDCPLFYSPCVWIKRVNNNEPDSFYLSISKNVLATVIDKQLHMFISMADLPVFVTI